MHVRLTHLTASRRARLALVALSAALSCYVLSIFFVNRGPGAWSSLWDGWVYNAILLGASIIAASRGRADRSARVPAFCFGGAIFAWFLGNVAWTFFVKGLANPPVPSIADVGYLVFYPPAIVGLLAAGRSGEKRSNPVVLLDGLIAGLSVTAAGAVVALGPIWRAASGSRAAIITNLAYPIMDLLMVGLVLTLAALTGWRLRRDQTILLAALVAFAIADSVYLVRVANETYKSGTLLDAGWLIPVVALAWGQWLNSAPTVNERPSHGRAVWVPIVFLGLALAAFTPSVAGDVPLIALVAMGGALIAAGGRMVVTLKHLERLAARELSAREERIAILALAREEIELANNALEARVQERTAEIEETNRRLTTTAEKLRQSNRELQEFAYVASHDLQEPLRKVRTFGSRLEQRFGDTLTDDGRDYLQRMQSAAARMSTLIDDLLTFSRVTSRSAGWKKIELTPIAREVLGDLEVQIEEARADVHVGLLPCVEADATQIRQLLQNLLGNSLKFRRPDVPLRITIGASLIESPVIGHPELDQGPYCRLEITDNGIGFEEKYLDRIFTVFQRLHGRSEYVGSGVGLAVCRRIVERHHGLISAESAPGAGARFIAFLPVTQPEEILP